MKSLSESIKNIPPLILLLLATLIIATLSLIFRENKNAAENLPLNINTTDQNTGELYGYELCASNAKEGDFIYFVAEKEIEEFRYCIVKNDQNVGKSHIVYSSDFPREDTLRAWVNAFELEDIFDTIRNRPSSLKVNEKVGDDSSIFLSVSGKVDGEVFEYGEFFDDYAEGITESYRFYDELGYNIEVALHSYNYFEIGSNNNVSDEVGVFIREHNLDPFEYCRSFLNPLATYGGIRSESLDDNHRLHIVNSCLGGAYNSNEFAFITTTGGDQQVLSPIVLENYDTETQRITSSIPDFIINPHYDELTQELEILYRGRGITDYGTFEIHKWDPEESRFILVELRIKTSEDIDFESPDYQFTLYKEWPIIYYNR